MYNASANFLQQIKQKDRSFRSTVRIGISPGGAHPLDIVITDDDIINWEVESSFAGDALPSIGGHTANKLTLTLARGNINENWDTEHASIKLYIGLLVNNGEGELYSEWYEDFMVGYFVFDSRTITKTKYEIHIEALTNNALQSDIEIKPEVTNTWDFPTQLENFWLFLIDNYGNSIAFAQDLTIPADLEWYNLMKNVAMNIYKYPKGTIRNIVSDFLMAMGRSAYYRRNENGTWCDLAMRKLSSSPVFSIDANHYWDFELLTPAPQTINKIKNTFNEEFVVEWQGAGYAGEPYFSYNNPIIATQQQINLTAESAGLPFTYQPYTLKCIGLPHIDVGDTIQLTTVDNEVVNCWVGSHKLIYDGSLVSEFSAGAMPTVREITNANEEKVSIALSELYAPPKRYTPTMTNNWQIHPNHGLTFFKQAGTVWLEGVARNGVALTSAFILPEGFRPLNNVLLPAVVNGNTAGTISITTNGIVLLNVSPSVISISTFTVFGCFRTN